MNQDPTQDETTIFQDVELIMSVLKGIPRKDAHKAIWRIWTVLNEQAVVVSAPSPATQGGKTGWPPGMLQDDSRELSRALASKPDALLHAREAAQAATQGEKPTAEAVVLQILRITTSTPGMTEQQLGYAMAEIDRLASSFIPPATQDQRDALRELAQEGQKMELTDDERVRDEYFRTIDEAVKLTGHKQSGLDIWLMAKGKIDTNHRKIDYEETVESVCKIFPPKLVASWFLHQQRVRRHLEVELKNCETRVANQRAEITRLQASVTTASIMTPRRDELSQDPDGDIAIDYSNSAGMLSMSISANGRLAWVVSSAVGSPRPTFDSGHAEVHAEFHSILLQALKDAS